MVITFDIETMGINAYRDKIILIGMKQGRKILNGSYGKPAVNLR
jgi:uncharacterized protein YprB with RNaseH-like and TPR domain